MPSGDPSIIISSEGKIHQMKPYLVRKHQLQSDTKYILNFRGWKFWKKNIDFNGVKVF